MWFPDQHFRSNNNTSPQMAMQEYSVNRSAEKWSHAPFQGPISRNNGTPQYLPPFVTQKQENAPMVLRIVPGPPVHVGHIMMPVWANFQVVPDFPRVTGPYPGGRHCYPSELQSSEEHGVLEEKSTEDFIVVDEVPDDSDSGMIEESKGVDGGNKVSERESNMKVEVGFCRLCKSNRELPQVYMGHRLKEESGRVECPILRAFVCRICGATGDNGHTQKYCPKRFGVTQVPGGSYTNKKNEVSQFDYDKTEAPYRVVRTSTGRFHSLKY